MKVDGGEILTLSDIRELDAETVESIRAELRAKLPQARVVEIDLSRTEFLDSSGLSGLVWLHKFASAQNGDVCVRVVNPAPAIQQLLELTRLHRLIEIVKRS